MCSSDLQHLLQTNPGSPATAFFHTTAHSCPSLCASFSPSRSNYCVCLCLFGPCHSACLSCATLAGQAIAHPIPARAQSSPVRPAFFVPSLDRPPAHPQQLDQTTVVGHHQPSLSSVCTLSRPTLAHSPGVCSPLPPSTKLRLAQPIHDEQRAILHTHLQPLIPNLRLVPPPLACIAPNHHAL